MRTAILLVLAVAQWPLAQQAVTLGRTRDTALFEAFNRGYELSVPDTLERAEIITEFRRAVLMVRDRANLGDYVYTAPELARDMVPHEGLITFVVQARLHPLNTYAMPPSYALYVETGETTNPLAPANFKRDAIYPPTFGRGTAMSAFRMEGTFRRAEIEAAAAPFLVVLDDKGTVLWKARIDLSRYR